jgi:hypothetical protein
MATPVPVSSVNALARLAELGVARKVATPVPRPARLAVGKPVVLVKVPEVGVPRIGVVKVGDVANTRSPEPVSSVTAEARFALEGVARKVATPVPRPARFAAGNPVVLVSVPDVGVPNMGVVNVGDVANTAKPVPVSSVTAAAKLALDGVVKNVATPVPRFARLATGYPVALVSTPDVGVPRIGVTNVGEVEKTSLSVPVSSEITPASVALVVAAN